MGPSVARATEAHHPPGPLMTLTLRSLITLAALLVACGGPSRPTETAQRVDDEEDEDSYIDEEPEEEDDDDDAGFVDSTLLRTAAEPIVDPIQPPPPWWIWASLGAIVVASILFLLLFFVAGRSYEQPNEEALKLLGRSDLQAGERRTSGSGAR